MAHVNRVLRSINNEDASRCVDIFLRPEGTISFEEYRRDVEDGLGWFSVTDNSCRSFDDEGAALTAALAEVPWLRGIVGSAKQA